MTTFFIESELLNAHHNYWKSYSMRGDDAIDKLLSLVSPSFSGIGTGKEEIINTKDEFNLFIQREHNEVPENVNIKIINEKVQLLNTAALVYAELELILHSENSEINLYARTTMLFEKAGASWLVYHLHVSFPSIDQSEGESFPLDKLKARNEYLETKISERTKELEVLQAKLIEETNKKLEESEKLSTYLKADNKRKTRELEEARQLQLSMLPKELPEIPHLNIAVYMKTATEVGGDYYDFNVGTDNTLTVVLGDATGHGMRAGTMVTTAKTLFKSYAANPDILFTFREMTRCIKQMQFQALSMCMTMLKIQNNKLVMSAAGMPPVYLLRYETGVIEEYLMRGMPLGTMENFPYELKEMELNSGDTILLMSDGFPELQNEHNEIYGYTRVIDAFEKAAGKEPNEIITFLKDSGSYWIKNNDPEDDITFIVIKVR